LSIATGDGLVADDRVMPRRKRRGWREITKGAARCGSPNLRNLNKGDSMSELDVILGMLKQSVVSIKGANGADTEALLAKSFDQFAEATREIVGAAEANAFEQGRYADLLKFDGADGSILAKGGMDEVAGFALVMKQLEFYMDGIVTRLEDSGTQEVPPWAEYLRKFYDAGLEIMQHIVHAATARGEPAEDEGAAPSADAQELPPNQPPPPAEPPAGKKPPPDPKSTVAEEGNQSDQSGDKSPPAEDDDEERKRALGKGVGGDMLAKFDALEQRLNKISSEKDEALAKAEADKAILSAEIEALRKSTPAPAKGVLMAVGKEADNALAKGDGADLQAEAERLNQLQKSDPAAYALALMKVAQRNPLPFDPRRQ
jgi:hypothetical protein